ncbi:hydrolase [Bradyrhizobium sp. WBAH42]|nr:hydrolase [Bradyrhizobium sp. WBAH30]MDD1540860.1 hydrolase [Bradyrhizobium sp. WBAH41]MDD1555696.1 hydrolase [Bradyrhizobium sp. WBAH23]MDD1563495.1 hydrolase [Bradyrhizobium sp. WBAH33]MDD1588004.1 hydrolase [Bradyrhizobium sp. WBAH42]NRB86552.1 hydrolase [Bradyrhizobium sp. WBAH10]QCJ90288.1 hydrolase [Bradyrhizobium yuanmingense]
MRCTLWVFAAILCCLGSPVQAAGIQLLQSDPALSGAIWYPCTSEPTHVALGSLSVGADFDLKGAKDCPVTGAKLPLVIYSHGRGGFFGQQHDTAEALADAGFIVAAINHPGDTVGDSSRRDTLSVWGSRPADIVRLLDFLLNDWKDRAAIDPTRVGFFGFSLGGATGLVLMGTTPDFARVAGLCRETTGACAQLHNGETPPEPIRDARIRAAVIVDPAPATLTRENLALVKVPFQFWRSQFGGPGVGDGSGNARVAESLPGKPDIHVVPAGHYAFLAPCSADLAAAVPRICTDVPAGFDRAGFHREFNAAVVGYFHQQLAGGDQ